VDEDLVLSREVEARRVLRERAAHFLLLAPHGSWIGCGALRVLRTKTQENELVEVVAGYESYQRLPASTVE
jgi:hypothetical protein